MKALPGKITQVHGQTVTGVTSAQEHFCVLATTYDDQGRLPSLIDALREAYPNAGEKTLRTHLCSMKKSKAVQKRLEELRVENYKKFCETAKERGIAVVAERVIRRNRDWERIEQIKTDRIEAATRIKKRIAELEQDLADTKDPKERRQIQERLDHWLEKHVALIGLESGLYVQDRKIIGQGENAEAIDFVRIDKAMMDAQLDLETATAKDLGQHRQAVDAVVHVKAYANFDPDEV